MWRTACGNEVHVDVTGCSVPEYAWCPAIEPSGMTPLAWAAEALCLVLHMSSAIPYLPVRPRLLDACFGPHLQSSPLSQSRGIAAHSEIL